MEDLVYEIFVECRSRPREVWEEVLASRLARGCEARVIERVRKLLEASDRASPRLVSVGDAGALVARAEVVEGYRLGAILREGAGFVVRSASRGGVRALVTLSAPGVDASRVCELVAAERNRAGMLSSASFPRVLEHGRTADGRAFVVGPCPRGVGVLEHCEAERLGLRARVGLFLEVCEAVAEAHGAGFVHGGLEAWRVVVGEGGHGGRIAVCDLELARALNAMPPGEFGEPSACDLEYAAPERLSPTSAELDARWDVYALGVMLYRLLTGSHPFGESEFVRGSVPERARLLMQGDAPFASRRVSASGAGVMSMGADALREELKRDLGWIPAKAMERDLARRYPTASELADDVRRYLEGRIVRAAPATIWYLARKGAGRVMKWR
jgi:hypothetical protein